MWKRILLSGIGVFVALAVLGSITRSHADYSDKSRSEFMKGCVGTGGDETGCVCIWNQFKAEVPEDEFAADAAAADKGDMTGAELRTKYRSIMEPCIQT